MKSSFEPVKFFEILQLVGKNSWQNMKLKFTPQLQWELFKMETPNSILTFLYKKLNSA